eukprot:1712185-Amphidinium_carterae.2
MAMLTAISGIIHVWGSARLGYNEACGGIESEKKDNVWRTFADDVKFGRLKVGLLQYGQSADIVVRANVPAGGKLEACVH